MDAFASLLSVERHGRSIAAELGTCDEWRLQPARTLEGAALLVAARWLHRWGRAAELRMPEGWDVENAPQPWRIYAESSRKIGLFEPHVTGNAENRIESISGGNAIPLGELQGEKNVWRQPREHRNRFIRQPARNEKVLTIAESREIDRSAIHDYGVPGICLMENAAIGGVAVGLDMLESGDRKIAVLAGGGNNGGDGLAMARGFAALGYAVDVFLMKAADALHGDAAINLRMAQASDAVKFHYCHDAPETLSAGLRDADLVVDALLGTGFVGEPSKPFGEAIDILNASSRKVLALDLPSGINGDGVATHGSKVNATRTATFAGMKTALIDSCCSKYTGDIFICDIGAPLQSIFHN